MKGIVLAGGSGTRMNALTKVMNKHLLPIYDKPMIYYPLQKLREVGIDDVMVIVDRKTAGMIISQLGSGKELGMRLTYHVQDAPEGIAHAIGLSKDFVGKEKFIVILGDNIFEDSLKEPWSDFTKSTKNAMIFIKPVDYPNQFGIAEIEGSRIISIEEKPEFPKSNLCVAGVYFYDSTIFNKIESIKVSRSNEYEITSINQAYIGDDKIDFRYLKGFWFDVGTLESYHKCIAFIADKKAMAL